MLGRSHTPEVRNLRAFEAAARFGSFRQAAVEPNLTQGAVSKMIKELEAQLNVTLFQRNARKLGLTDAGRRFLPETQEIPIRLERASLDVMALEGRESTLSVATLPTFGSRWLMPRLTTFMTAHPGAQIDIASRHRPFDIAIHYGAPVWPSAICTYLCGEEIAAVLSSELAGRYNLGDLASLRAHIEAETAPPFLHLEERPKLWTTWLNERGLPSTQAFRGNRFDTFSLLIGGALAGAGLALVPTYLIEAELSEGALVPLDTEAMRTDESYHTVVPANRERSAICRCFEEWLHASVGRHPPPIAARAVGSPV